MEAKVISRRLREDQFGLYISETLADGTKRNIAVKQKTLKSGRLIEDEYEDEEGYIYSTGAKG